jgi:hypothetical protein
MHVVCADNIVVLWCVGVSYFQGGGGMMFACREMGCDWQLLHQKTCSIIKYDICRSSVVLRHRRCY